MPFIEKIRNYRSLSIVGLEKNTGKTVCLNYLLNRLHDLDVTTAVTSIGVDGEQVDAVYATAKPEITLYEGMQFITAQKHYYQRRLVSRILSVDERRTSLGQLVTAEVLCSGKALLSGAATTSVLKEQINHFRTQGVQLTIVDGALSRLSLASPTVTEAMILATGAAVSPNVQQLISKTRFVYRLIDLPEVDAAVRQKLAHITSGIWAIDGDLEVHDLGIRSVFLLGRGDDDLFRFGTRLFVAGAVSDRLFKYLSNQPNIGDIELIVQDFTKFFVSPEAYADYLKRGGKLWVLQRSNLIAVCLNPTSPQGYRLNSAEVCAQLSDALGCPVYDVVAGI
ncbi:MAG: hypothetical protein KBT28_11460 [Bacteroidales bacterium]|nr:hypothetical protein [Candidatus Colimorpha merdihippi]